VRPCLYLVSIVHCLGFRFDFLPCYYLTCNQYTARKFNIVRNLPFICITTKVTIAPTPMRVIPMHAKERRRRKTYEFSCFLKLLLVPPCSISSAEPMLTDPMLPILCFNDVLSFFSALCRRLWLALCRAQAVPSRGTLELVYYFVTASLAKQTSNTSTTSNHIGVK
jgi:hypothetical protein